MKKTVLALAVAATLVCATMAWSQGGNRQGGFGGRGGQGKDGRAGGHVMMSCPGMAIMLPHSSMLDRIAKKLQLTEDQSAKLSKIVTKSEETIKPLQLKATESSKAFKDFCFSSNYDSKKISELAAIAEKDEAALISAKIDAWTQVRAVFTTEQLSKLQESMRSHRPGAGQRGGKGMGRGQGDRPSGPPQEDGDGYGPPPPPAD